MPVYQFAVRWNEDRASDVRYTHLADEAAARRYAKQLADESASTGFYPYSCRSRVEVKNEDGSVLFSIPFREMAPRVLFPKPLAGFENPSGRIDFGG